MQTKEQYVGKDTHKMVIALGPLREEGYHIDVLLLEDSSFSAWLHC